MFDNSSLHVGGPKLPNKSLQRTSLRSLSGVSLRGLGAVAELVALGVLRTCPGIEASLFSSHASTPR